MYTWSLCVRSNGQWDSYYSSANANGTVRFMTPDDAKSDVERFVFNQCRRGWLIGPFAARIYNDSLETVEVLAIGDPSWRVPYHEAETAYLVATGRLY